MDASLASEKIGVAKIRLRHAAEGGTAVLGSFRAADKVLQTWASCPEKHFECALEVVYMDGRVVSGPRVEWHRRLGRPSLGNFVRASLQSERSPGHFPSPLEMKTTWADPRHAAERYDSDD